MLTLVLSGVVLIIWGFIILACWIVFSPKESKEKKYDTESF